jgi:hypothetical protein
MTSWAKCNVEVGYPSPENVLQQLVAIHRSRIPSDADGSGQQCALRAPQHVQRSRRAIASSGNVISRWWSSANRRGAGVALWPQ